MSWHLTVFIHRKENHLPHKNFEEILKGCNKVAL